LLKRPIIIKPIKKILFLGLGGAGQRHLRIFNTLLPSAKKIAFRQFEKTPMLNPDFSVAVGQTLEKHYNLDIYRNLNSAYKEKPDLVVISLPSANLANAVVNAANHGCNIFVEKPAAINLQEAKKIKQVIEKNKVEFFVSFQRRFHPVIKELKSKIDSGFLGSIISISVEVGSNVPDWHPYENFLDLYACKRELGGGVLRTECHEMDLLNWIFGPAKRVFGVLQNRSKYILDVEDSADLILDYENFCASVKLCFMTKNQERVIEIKGEKGMIRCDLNRNEMFQLDFANNVEDCFKANDLTPDSLFLEQAKFFINNKASFKSSYINAVETLTSLFDRIEISNKQQ